MPQPQPRSAPAAGDAVAISLSGLCLAHCLALPLLAGFLPLAGAWAEAEWVHWLFAAIAAPVSLLTLARPADRSPSILSIALIGLAFLFAGAAGFPSHDLETPLTVTGGLLLAAAHLLNGRRRAACAHDA
jgi:hypothetical protein